MLSRSTKIVSIAALAISMVSLGLTIANMRSARTVNYQTHTVPAPEPSREKPCLPLSPEGVNTFKPGEVESADFCVPGGAPILELQTSDTEAWAFSQPWKEAANAIPDRLAFERRQAQPPETQVVIQAGQKQYFLVITALQDETKGK